MKKSILYLLCLSLNAVATAQRPNEDRPFGSHFNFVLESGYSYRTAKVQEYIQGGLDDYAKSLKSGYNIGLNGNYFFKDNWGFGLKYAHFGSKGGAKGVFLGFTSQSDVIYGKITDNIGIDYIGPSYLNRFFFGSSKRHALNTGVGLGYMRYKDKATAANTDVLITGSTLGSFFDMGYDYSITKEISVGLKSGYYAGVLNSYTIQRDSERYVEKLDKDNREGLGRLDLNLGLVVKI